MSTKDKWVRRFSVDETAKHKNGFTIYKIKSVLFPIESPEAVTVVSVWKRYSDVQRLHKSMRSLHAGLHLRGVFPTLARYSFFKRFNQEVIEERAKTIKNLLEFIAEHRLLFASTDFVNFLQTGYPEPESQPGGIINAIRSSLHLPIEETPPLEYQTDDDDSRSPTDAARLQQPDQSIDELDSISQIPIYSSCDVERRPSPEPKLSAADSFESFSSLDSISSSLLDELSKVPVTNHKPLVRNSSTDLISFDGPSTSRREDATPMGSRQEDAASVASNVGSEISADDRRSGSTVSLYSKKSAISLSTVESKTKTEDSYVFEAGYMLSLAARCADGGDYRRAFHCYKCGIEKMLIGVHSDPDPHRRALIKEKTNKYLTYAEAIYKNHLCDNETSLLPEREDNYSVIHCPIPISMLKRPYEDLAMYRVLAVLSSSIMLVLHKSEQACYAMKVIQKIPNNLTEFDEYFLQRTKETREPVLPTVIPYMVPLHAYIETNNLIFLILAYAPGEKLFNYIKNYAKSVPNTPAREVNLENVFTEPKEKSDLEPKVKSDLVNDNVVSVDDVRIDVNVNNNESKTENVEVDNVDVLVLNSKTLLKNVDRVLSDTKTDVGVEGVRVGNVEDVERDVVTPNLNRLSPCPRDVLPPSAVCAWGAEILTAIESLHNSGVVCRDLNPTNILLGSHGQVLLTYFFCYPGPDMALAATRPRPGRDLTMYLAPELYANTILERDKDEGLEKLCDYWSFGAIMYELLCGVPLSYYHRSVFTSHTVLQLPEGLSVEVESLLTQLLTYEPLERLGSGKDGVEEIKRHPYFRQIDWRHVYEAWTSPTATGMPD